MECMCFNQSINQSSCFMSAGIHRVLIVAGVGMELEPLEPVVASATLEAFAPLVALAALQAKATMTPVAVVAFVVQVKATPMV